MRLIRALISHPFAGASLRYAVAGATVAGVYLAIPIGLSAMGMAIQIAIPIAYVLAVTLHFNLQRRFVFRHIEEFALSTRRQAARYVAVGAIQYPTTAVATAFLPKLLGISPRAAFVLITIAISACFFLALRGLVFHPADRPADGRPPDGERSAKPQMGQRDGARGREQAAEPLRS